MYTYVAAGVCVCMYVCMRVCVRVYTHMDVCINIYIYIYKNIKDGCLYKYRFTSIYVDLHRSP